MKMDIMIIIGLIIGILIGGVIGYGVRYIQGQLIIKTLESERDAALLAKASMKVEWEKALQKIEDTTTMLKDTLAAIEVFKMYQAIDQDTKDKLKQLRDTYDENNKPTDDTFNKFRQMVDEINRRNKEYNTGFTTGAGPELTAEQLYKNFIADIIEVE